MRLEVHAFSDNGLPVQMYPKIKDGLLLTYEYVYLLFALWIMVQDSVLGTSTPNIAEASVYTTV